MTTLFPIKYNFVTGRHAENHWERSDGQSHRQKNSGQKEKNDHRLRKCNKYEIET